jgi:methyltransferase (TIGR00027 family)
MSDMNKKPKHKVSKTARVTRFTRAMSYFDKNPVYKTDDYIAPILIPARYKVVVRNPLTRYIYMKRFGDSGVYEYIIARTRIIDDIFRNLSADIQQVLIFGAGFDSRAVRFRDNLHHAAVYELDYPSTQQNKIKRYRQMKIAVPPNLNFIPIDFRQEDLSQALDAAGFRKNEPGLYLLEGLIFYLEPDTVDGIFNCIREYSGKGSILVFDYLFASVLRRENICYGEKRCYQFVILEGEEYRFGIEKGQIPDFLSKYGFKPLEEYDASRMENIYFTDATGSRITRVNGMHTLVVAGKM